MVCLGPPTFRSFSAAHGKLGVPRYLFANQMAQHSKDAVEIAFLGPCEEVLHYPANDNVSTPEGIVASIYSRNSIHILRFRSSILRFHLQHCSCQDLAPLPLPFVQPFPLPLVNTDTADTDMLNIAGSESARNLSLLPTEDPIADVTQLPTRP